MMYSYLVTINLLTAILLVCLTTSYMTSYYWWHSPTGRVVVSGLLSAEFVVTGGLFERWGYIEVHDILVSVGYTGAAIVLLLATIRVVQLKNGSSAKKTHHIDDENMT